MITYRFKIENAKEMNELGMSRYPSQYSYMFKHIYNKLELHVDKGFIEETLKKFPLMDKSLYDVCVGECLDKYKKWEITQQKNIESIEQCKDRLEYLNSLDKKTNQEKQECHKLIKKLSKKKKRIGKHIVFGSLSELRNVTHFAQTGDEVRYKDHLDKYQKKREIGLYFVGRACEGGNRKFDFHFDKNEVVFKPSKDKHFNLKLKPFKNVKHSELQKIQSMIDADQIPISVRLYKDELQITVDNELINGYSFNKNDFRKACVGKGPEGRKQEYIKHVNEQKDRKLEGKLDNTIAAIDLNPEYIGLSILKLIDNKIKVVFTTCFDLVDLLDKEDLSSTGKRKHEICHIYKQIFSYVKHFRCYRFAYEDLDFKPKKETVKSREFNRMTKNLWNRNLQEQLINKYCQNLGVEIVQVNPVYSSFIGNCLYPNIDPIAASIEIGRRGFFKYIKGASLYPSINSIPKEKMSYLLRESTLDEKALSSLTWPKLYKDVTVRKLRYRNLEKSRVGSFLCKKTKVYICI